MIHVVNVLAFDLNHVRALHHLLEETHVKKAAQRLGITPAAASNALRRLRVDFDDPLLVRKGRALVRTAGAERLRAPAYEMMRAAAKLFETHTPFDPLTYEGDFVFVASDRVAELLLPPIDALLRERAPHAGLVVRTIPTDLGEVLRDQGGLAVTPSTSPAAGFVSEPLFADDLVCVLRKGHPLLTGAWSLRRFAAAEHVLVAPRGEGRRGMVDDLLEARGLSRRVTRLVTTFSQAIPLLVSSNCVATLPRTFAEARTTEFPLIVRKPPLVLPPIPMRALWHEAHAADPKHIFWRKILKEAVKTAAPQERHTT